MAAEDRAVAKTLLGGVLAVLHRSYSSRPDALAQCRDLLDDLELAGTPCDFVPPVATRDSDSRTASAPNGEARLAKALRDRKRAQAYIKKLDATIAKGPDVASSSASDAPSDGTQENCAAHSAPLSPSGLHATPADRSVPADSVGFLTPPRTCDVDETALGLDVSSVLGRLGGEEFNAVPLGQKRSKRSVYSDLGWQRAAPLTPGTPSPSKGMLMRDATMAVRSYLAASQHSGVGPDGVSYMAGMLVKYTENDWDSVLLNWGEGAIAAYTTTGRWRH